MAPSLRVLLLLLLLLLCGASALGVGWSGWLDRTKPALHATLPAARGGVYRGVVPLTITASDASPGLSSLTVWLDDGPARDLPLAGGVLPIDTPTLSDGTHTLRLAAVDAARAGNRAEVSLSFVVDNTMPSLEVAEGSLRATQGRTLALYLRSDEPLVRLEATVLGKGRRFFEVSPGLWRALVGVEIQQAVGPAPLVIEAEDGAGNIAHAEVPLWVEAGTFPEGGTIRLSAQQTAARQDAQALEAMRKERSDLWRHHGAEQRWLGPMRRPTAGRRTSAFGRYRTYSDGRRSHHGGTDLADVTGTPVGAAAAGVVRHAGWQHLLGNTVVLDHGQGVLTSYSHLSAIQVQVGASVAAGDVVGAVGSTGQSTGPHLHWGLIVDGVAVDAEEWLDRDFSPDELPTTLHLSQIEGGAVWPLPQP